MLFYFDGQGSSIKVSSEPVYQGSNNVGVIYFIAPFDRSSSVTVSFTLPDGSVISPILMEDNGEIVNSRSQYNALNYSVWRTSLVSSLTAKTGVVFVNFSVVNNWQMIATERVSFTVLKGSEPTLPAEPTPDVYQSILEEVAYLRTRCYEIITDEDIENIPTLEEKERWNGKQDALTFDNAPTQHSANPVKSSGVFNALSGKQNILTFDETPTRNSNNPVKSGGVFTALSGKQDVLILDDAPTQNSANPIKSSAVFSAIASCVAKSDNICSQNLSVGSWVGDSTYAEFPYRAEISIANVTQDFFAQVVFSPEQALSGNYCPVCRTANGKVVVFSKVNNSITIPTIICRRI